MTREPIAIVSARRTPIGSFLGKLSKLKAPELSSATITAALQDAGVEASNVSEVILGCVLPAGIGQAPARQAALGAGIPVSVGCTTINKVCGSGMKAVMLGHDIIRAGSAEIVVAGGMESMSNAPYLLPKARSGYRMGHYEVLDHMFFDGLQDPFDGNLMGHYGEETAAKYGFTREEQDEYAVASVKRSLQATESGQFSDEIVPLTIKGKRRETIVDQDEEPFRCDIVKIPKLRPAFRPEGGTITAATSSSISDGAASLVLMGAKTAEKRGVEPLARIIGHHTHAHEPAWFTTAPIYAVQGLQKKLDWTPATVDLYEINEAFACVPMAAMQELGISHEQINVHGGGCALGHPIGASGARILVTLVHALLQDRKSVV